MSIPEKKELEIRAVNWHVCTEWPSWPLAEVHLWRMDLGRAPGDLPARRAMLSPDELARADRFRFEPDRERFIRARSFLRALLGQYLNAPPQSLVFGYGAYGKPTLALKPHGKPFHFNLTHTEDLVLIAVTGSAEIGIDAERIGPAPYANEVAARFFSPADLAWLRGGEERFFTERFFQLWTRREASLKALGTGLFGLTPNDNGHLSSISVVNLNVGEIYAVAVALCGSFPPLQAWDWEETSG